MDAATVVVVSVKRIWINAVRNGAVKRMRTNDDDDDGNFYLRGDKSIKVPYEQEASDINFLSVCKEQNTVSGVCRNFYLRVDMINRIKMNEQEASNLFVFCISVY